MKQPDGTSKKQAREGLLYGSLALLVLLLVGADVMYFKRVAGVSAGASEASGLADCVYDPGKAPVADFEKLIGEQDPYVGNPEASVILIEFFDPNCPHCKSLHPVMKATLAKYAGEVRLVYKPVALPQFPASVGQNVVLFAADEAGKFSEMLDLQFAGQKREGISFEELKGLALQLGLDAEAIEQGFRDGTYDDRLNLQHQHAQEAAVTGVPAVLINGRFVATRSRTEACLGELIEAALEKAG